MQLSYDAVLSESNMGFEVMISTIGILAQKGPVRCMNKRKGQLCC